MEFKKYQHIERFGTTETQGVEFGECYVFPKIDGTNASIWVDDLGYIQTGSRNRELTEGKDNGGFYKYVKQNTQIKAFFNIYPYVRLYGEWLIPHTIKTYNVNAWRQFYVFDVERDGELLSYDEYIKLLENFDIEYIPPICKIKNPSYERLIGLLEKNTYLIEDGKGPGEGLVIKNYEYKNKFNNQIWAKIVRNDFKVKHAKVMGTTELQEKKLIEMEIVNKYINCVLINKEYDKIILDSGGWSSKLIPRLLNTVYYCLVKEESWDFVKAYKFPVIDFNRLKFLTIQKIKELKPELF